MSQSPPSFAQRKILKRIEDGASLALDPKTGRYVLTELDGKIVQVDQRPVLVMLRKEILFQNLLGQCICT
jgi:hypothetical protein